MIQKALYELLSNDPVLQGIGVDISPMNTDVDKNVPLVTYDVQDDLLYTKTNSDAVKSNLGFLIVSDDYIELNDIANQVFLVLDKYKGTAAGVEVRSIDAIGAQETRDKTNNLYMKDLSMIAIWRR